MIRLAVRIGLLGMLAYVALSACSLTVDLDELKNGDCGSGQKLCGSTCVPLTNPNTHCADKDECVPCTFNYATAKCGADGKCQIANCTGDNADCDGKAETGCEKDLAHNVDACGSCNTKCTTAHGQPGCTNSRCSIRSCDAGYLDCDKDVSNGCETAGTTCPP